MAQVCRASWVPQGGRSANGGLLSPDRTGQHFSCRFAAKANERQFDLKKLGILGYLISLAGAALWLYGYFWPANPPLVNWQNYSPWWVANFLPSLQAEVGIAMMFVGTALSCWPPRQD